VAHDERSPVEGRHQCARLVGSSRKEHRRFSSRSRVSKRGRLATRREEKSDGHRKPQRSPLNICRSPDKGSSGGKGRQSARLGIDVGVGTSHAYLVAGRVSRLGGELRVAAEEDPTFGRLEDQITWYDLKSQANQRRFKWTKAAQMVSAGAIPVAAALGGPGAVAAALGALVILLEGLLQLNQYQQNWINYRSTAEALKHEKYLYMAHAGPYGAAVDDRALLAERIEGLISQEHAKWISAREEAAVSRSERSQSPQPK